MRTPKQMKKFYICADVSHTRPAEAGYLFSEDMQGTNCEIAVWLRYNVKGLLTHDSITKKWIQLVVLVVRWREGRR